MIAAAGPNLRPEASPPRRTRRPRWRSAWLAMAILIVPTTPGRPAVGQSTSAGLPAVRVQPLSSPDQRSNPTALVFVHGLGGTPYCSFSPACERTSKGEPPFSWFKVFAQDTRKSTVAGRVDEFAIYSLDYSDAFKTPTYVTNVAQAFKESKEFQKIFRDHTRIIFVAHSLGGLVLQRTLISLWQHDRAILQPVRAVILLGTPAKGAPFAYWVRVTRYIGRYALRNAMKQLIGLDVDATQVRDLRTVDDGNPFIADLQNNWNGMLGSNDRPPAFELRCAYETVPETGTIIVVPKDYIEPLCTSPKAFAIKHTLLPKPPLDQNPWPMHEWVVEEILAVFDREPREREFKIVVDAPSCRARQWGRDDQPPIPKITWSNTKAGVIGQTTDKTTDVGSLICRFDLAALGVTARRVEVHFDDWIWTRSTKNGGGFAHRIQVYAGEHEPGPTWATAYGDEHCGLTCIIKGRDDESYDGRNKVRGPAGPFMVDLGVSSTRFSIALLMGDSNAKASARWELLNPRVIVRAADQERIKTAIRTASAP